jgi:hypothetical protein
MRGIGVTEGAPSASHSLGTSPASQGRMANPIQVRESCPVAATPIHSPALYYRNESLESECVMRLVRILVPVAVLGLAPVCSQAQTSDATAAQQAPSPLDLPIETIADSTGGCAVLDKDFPGLRDHPMYPFFKAMTLNQIAAMSKGQITRDMLAQARTDLATLKTTPAPDETTTASSDASATTDVAETPALALPVAMTIAAPLAPTPVSATVAAMH